MTKEIVIETKVDELEARVAPAPFWAFDNTRGGVSMAQVYGGGE